MAKNAKNTRPGKGTSVVYSWFHPNSAASFYSRMSSPHWHDGNGHDPAYPYSRTTLHKATFNLRFQNCSYKGVNQTWHPEEISAWFPLSAPTVRKVLVFVNAFAYWLLAHP
ncbi:hypothetical protein [Paenibacillus xylanilyticus]|uniref:hypothetical protein n=1 Tax=Paenibacillus xylanilyticus TaxID=248903 RepID=UPI0039A3B6DD